jgi:hypothetical protein
MEINKDALTQTYRTKTDDELLGLHTAGNLTEMAYEVIETELTRRGIAFTERSKNQIDHEITTKYKPSRWWTVLHLWGGLCALTFINITWFKKALTGILSEEGFRMFGGGDIRTVALSIGIISTTITIVSFLFGYYLSRLFVSTIDTSSFSIATKITVKVILPFAYIIGMFLLASLFLDH